MTFKNKCMFAKRCKAEGQEEHCNSLCYPFKKLHGYEGLAGGLQRASGIPKAYLKMKADNLPFKSANPLAFKIITSYIQGIMDNVEQGMGLYIYSEPNDINPLGTGTGKTTAAVAILNEYLINRVVADIQGKSQLGINTPCAFINVQRLQNAYTKQFRGTRADQEKATGIYNDMVILSKTCDLVVFDDIGVREVSEGFRGELYDIIDIRHNDGKASIFTSNIPLPMLGKLLDERIQSRINGAASLKVKFIGEDMRGGSDE